MDSRMKTATGPTILLHSSFYFDLLDPAGSRFTLGDIAHGLGNTCRFAGQCARFYSVAEHSWHASYLVPGHLQFAALMHDAAEAFIGDVTRPLKSLLPAYKEIEARSEAVIDERFATGGLCSHPLVKHADLRMLAAEQAKMMPVHEDHWGCIADVEVPEITFKWWRPDEASRFWMARAEQLLGVLNASDLERVEA